MNRIRVDEKRTEPRNNRGMTTPEACIIIPMTFTIIMLLLWMGFLFYNRNVLDQAAARAAIIGGQNSYLSNEEIAEKVNAKVAELINNKLILMDEDSIIVSTGVSLTEIKVSVSGEVRLPESIFFGKLYSKRLWDISVIESAPRLKNCRFVRLVQRLTGDGDSNPTSE